MPPAVPGAPKAIVIVGQKFSRHPTGGHGGIRFVPNVVVAGHKARLHVVARQLRQRFIAGLGKVAALGELLDQVAHVDNQRRFVIGGDGCYLLQGIFRPCGLAATRREFNLLAPGVEHVVRIGNDHKFKTSRWQERAIKHLFTLWPRMAAELAALDHLAEHLYSAHIAPAQYDQRRHPIHGCAYLRPPYRRSRHPCPSGSRR